MKLKYIFYGILVIYFYFPQLVSAQLGRPEVDLRADPVYFSPNEDKLQDQTFFYPVLRTNNGPDREVNRWRMWIRKPNGKKIQKLNGPGLPSLIKWDGQSKKEEPAEEGAYKASLVVWGKGFKISSPQVDIFVDNTPPVVSLSVSQSSSESPSAVFQPLIFSPQVQDGSPISHWQLQIMDIRGHIVEVISSTAPLAPIKWNGTSRRTGTMVPKGNYRCAFVAWDVAGNESAPAFLDVAVDVSTQQMLEQILGILTVFETDMGLIVQLPSEKIFDIKNGKPVIRPKEEALFKEVAILANAYADVSIQIDGYSFSEKTADDDKSLSSLYGWAVYSYLVKKGDVKASRMQVRGRGRSPMFERRQNDAPPDLVVLRNGVEVILLGNRDWSR